MECKKQSESRSVMSSSLRPHGLYSPWISPGQNTAVGSFSLLQVIFPTQGLNPGLPYCRWILYQLSHQGSTFPSKEQVSFNFIAAIIIYSDFEPKKIKFVTGYTFSSSTICATFYKFGDLYKSLSPKIN